MTIRFILARKDVGTFPALRAGKRAFRCKSSVLLMQILWAFRFNAPEDGRFPLMTTMCLSIMEPLA
jgi:hypothetical protein